MVLVKMRALVLPVLALVALTGCIDNRSSNVEKEMENIRKGSAAPVEPLPQPQKIEDFVYSAFDVRSPFLAPSLLTMQTQLEQNTGVKPDVNRKKEPLEEYELSQLIYRGKVVAPNGQEYGLVQLPDNYVEKVQVGGYMGKNDGRILEITPTQINLEEIVPDSRSGFTYKKNSLVTPN